MVRPNPTQNWSHVNNPNLEPENSIETYVKMDTDTGLVYEAKKQMQLNMFIQENLIKRNEFDFYDL